MAAPTFNMFKSTTVYGAFNNVDYPDNSVLASAYFQRNLTVSGDITCSGIINGNKLFYDNVDISSTFVSNASLTTALNSYALLSGATFYGTLNALTPTANDISTKVATTTFVNTKLSATLTGYANITGATFTGPLRAITQATTDNTTLVATTAYVKSQNYLTSNPDLSPYALLSGSTFTGMVNFNNGLTTGAAVIMNDRLKVKNIINIFQESSTTAPVLQFLNEIDQAKALIYPSAIANVLRFSILSQQGLNGFEFENGSTGDKLMILDLNGNLTLAGNGILNCTSVKCTGLLDSTNASGTSGQICTANGSGGWTWVNPTTSSNSVFGTQQILK